MFEEESKRIGSIFRDELVDIHHIGSSSVTGLSAKPISDIIPIVKDIERVDHFNEQMKKMGYEAMGNMESEGAVFQEGRHQKDSSCPHLPSRKLVETSSIPI